MESSNEQKGGELRAGHFGAKVIRAHKTRRSERGGVRRKLEGKAGENDRKDL